MTQARADNRLVDLTRRLEALAQPHLLAFALGDAMATVQDALQFAIELELSTLPPYLCAMWSIVQADTNVGSAIFGVCLDEMHHMGLACNMLTALGGTPSIKAAYYANVHYPTNGLPGSVLPGLVVDLGNLTHDRVVKQFQAIEQPENEIKTALLADPPYTIGRFYDELLKKLPADGWTAGKPLNDPFLNPWITSQADAQRAIHLIQQQGEGTSGSPYAAGKRLAHFYVFEQIARQNGITGITGNPPTLVWADPPDPAWQLPPSYDMKRIDDGGRYLDPPAAVAPLLQAFNMAWDTLLTDLDDAWRTNSLPTLQKAKDDMKSLTAAAQALFNLQVDSAQPNLRYGPEFTSPA